MDTTRDGDLTPHTGATAVPDAETSRSDVDGTSPPPAEVVVV